MEFLENQDNLLDLDSFDNTEDLDTITCDECGTQFFVQVDEKPGICPGCKIELLD